MSICPTATMCLVTTAPGQARVIQTGKMLIAPPTKIAAQTWM